MKSIVLTGFFALVFVVTLSSFGVFEEIKEGVRTAHKYEKAALRLAKENRELRAQMSKVRYDLASVKTKNDFLQIKLNKKTQRAIASIPKKNHDDLVRFEVYKWSADKLSGIGGKEFHFKNFEKSAQYYNALLKRYPSFKGIDDKTLFAAGIAAYESGKHYKWAESHLQSLVKKYPKSKFYRGAKLWLALSKLNMGDKKYFYSTVEEFRQKYRNTHEWKILSRHYETITRNYQK
jgi:TolA-binding protein